MAEKEMISVDIWEPNRITVISCVRIFVFVHLAGLGDTIWRHSR